VIARGVTGRTLYKALDGNQALDHLFSVLIITGNENGAPVIHRQIGAAARSEVLGVDFLRR